MALVSEDAGRAKTRAQGRRAKGDGGCSQSPDGTWETTIELPKGPDGRRRRKTFSAKTEAEALRKARCSWIRGGRWSTSPASSTSRVGRSTAPSPATSAPSRPAAGRRGRRPSLWGWRDGGAPAAITWFVSLVLARSNRQGLLSQLHANCVQDRRSRAVASYRTECHPLHWDVDNESCPELRTRWLARWRWYETPPQAGRREVNRAPRLQCSRRRRRYRTNMTSCARGLQQPRPLGGL